MTKFNTFGIVFFLKKQKARNGKAPVYARITIDGRRSEISLKRDVEVTSWDTAKGMAKGKNDEIRKLNTILEQIRGRIVECYQELKVGRKSISAEILKNSFLGIEEKEFTLMNLFDYHNEQMNKTLRWGTLKNYFTTKSYFQRYLKSQYKVSDIALSDLNYSFLVGYEKYMKDNPSIDPKNPCHHNTIMKHIERLNKVVNLAIKNEWLDKDPFTKFKKTFVRKERDYLTTEELERLETYNFQPERLGFARDLFVFSCYTGLAYIDVFDLTPSNVVIGIDKDYWISTSRRKTDQIVRIPLLPKALEIIQKYQDHPVAIANCKLLPTYSNQKLNAYLKEIAKVCAIEKNLTFHVARHTFATSVTLINGVPIETVSKLLGHTSIRTTQIYARVVEKKVSDDMRQLREKLSSSASKAQKDIA